MSIEVPAPYYTLIETTKGSDPAIVVVNSALRTFAARKNYSWHLKITIDCKTLGANGMPTTEESEVLVQLEEEITRLLAINENSIFLARITCRGSRDLKYRIRNPRPANDALEELSSITPPTREWEYRIEQDIDWNLANPELSLIERDLRIN